MTLTIRDSSEVAPGTEEGCRDGCEGSNVFIELEKSNGQTCSTTKCKLTQIPLLHPQTLLRPSLVTVRSQKNDEGICFAFFDHPLVDRRGHFAHHLHFANLDLKKIRYHLPSKNHKYMH